MELVEVLQLLIVSLAAASAFLLLRRIGIPGQSGRSWRQAPAQNKSNSMLNLPPEPPSWPVVGHLPVFAASSHPHRELHRLSEQYGPILHLRLGARPAVLVSSPEIAREVLKTQDRNFASRPPTPAFDHLGFKDGSIGANPYGSRWRYLRKIATFELLTPKRIQDFEGVRKQEMTGLLRSILDDSAHEATQRMGVNMYEKLSALSMNLMTLVVMGKRFFHVAAATTTPPEQATVAEAAEFKELIKELNRVYGVQFVGDHSPYLAFLDWLPKRRLTSLHAKLDKFLFKILDEHRKEVGKKPETEQDFMDVLLSLQDEDGKAVPDSTIKGLVLTMLLAGVDTSTTSTEWAFSEVILHPRVRCLAQQELDSVVGQDRRVDESDLADLHYLQAIVKESMRLHAPTALLLPHAAINSAQVAGYDIPAGTTVFVNSWSLGRNKEAWENPTQFIPERFFGREFDITGQNFEHIPFGSGRRACPGLHLGLRHVQLALAHLLHCFDWSLPPGQKAEDVDMMETYGLTLPKTIPMFAVPYPRLPPHLY